MTSWKNNLVIRTLNKLKQIKQWNNYFTEHSTRILIGQLSSQVITIPYRNLNFKIKTGGPHPHLGAAAPCIYELIAYSINMFVFTSTWRIHDSVIDCYSALGIRLYFTVIAQLQLLLNYSYCSITVIAQLQLLLN